MPDTNALLEMRREWREGSRTVAKELARSYVYEFREELAATYNKYTLEDLVKEVDVAREKRDHLRVLEIECWLLSEYEPQHIYATLGFTPADVAQAVSESLNRAQRRARQ